MNQNYLLPILLFFFLSTFSADAQRIYVNCNAAGDNNGHSWAEAFTNLQDALAAAPEGAEIWVAAGTYTPTGPEGGPGAAFLIDENIQLLGGFLGNETEADSRDPEANLSILSGDLNGDDLPGDLENNRSDNVQNVVRIEAQVTPETLIEGFVITGGQADGPTAPQDGGGIYCSGEPTIRYCVFMLNLARGNGGALFLNEIDHKGIIIEHCRFEKNRANRGGALYSAASQLAISECTFTQNAANIAPNQKNGGGIYCIESYGLIEDCSFTDNFAFDFGAGLFVRTSPGAGDGLELRNCLFENNTALFNQGGGAFLYISGDNNRFVFSKCHFAGNEAGTWGGGLHFVDRPDASYTSFVMDNCSFHRNSVEIIGDGSAMNMSLAGEKVNVQITNSTFTENTTDFFATAAIWALNNNMASGDVLVGNCTFQHNTAKHSAGLDMGSFPNAGLFHYRVQDCFFLSNHALGKGGALTVYSESPATYEVENCHFEGNTADGQGGAMWLAANDPDFQALIRDCVFKGNQSPLGGAVLAYPLAFPITQEADIRIENSLFVENISDQSVIAAKWIGAISLFNCTVANNQAGGLLFDTNTHLELQNTILFNPGFTEFTGLGADTTITVISGGGNLVRDSSMQTVLNNADQQLFDQPVLGQQTAAPILDAAYRLTSNSPAIDAGIIYESLPDLDLAGNSRVRGSCIDIGAYESPHDAEVQCQMVGARQARIAVSTLELYPNPARSLLKIELPESPSQAFPIELLNAQGKLVSRQMAKNGGLLDVEALPGGIYWVKAVVKGVVYTSKLIKR